ncbi:MAG: hypothetical protein ACRCSN_06105 [Dermatophilaceae bacterium]
MRPDDGGFGFGLGVGPPSAIRPHHVGEMTAQPSADQPKNRRQINHRTVGEMTMQALGLTHDLNA